MQLIFLGAPGAGKGTQAARVSAALGIPAISTGDMIRSAIRDKTPLGLELKEIIDQGHLVSDEVIIRLMKERLDEEDCQKGFLLDGFPRTMEQAKFLDSVTRIHKVVDLVVSDGDIQTRMSGRRFCPKCQKTYHTKYQKPLKDGVCDACGSELAIRPDDAPETVLERLKVYHRQTEPLITYYGERVVKIDGNRDPETVTEDILKALQA